MVLERSISLVLLWGPLGSQNTSGQAFGRFGEDSGEALGSQDGSRWSQDGPTWGQDGAKMGHVGAKMDVI